MQMLNEELKINTRAFRIIDLDNLNTQTDNSIHEDDHFIPTISLGENKLDSGFGFVHHLVRSPDQLMSSVASAVEIILNHFNLELYVDVFDARKLTRLKQIARVQGVKALIDSVVQTAYYAGYKGDSDSAQAYLDRAEFLTDVGQLDEEIPLENCAKKFLSHAMTHGENAHSFIKSCLSYYVVSKQGHTMTRASQLLSISRTTLNEHLKIASRLGVHSFLEGRNYKNNLT
jgi:hypothetical protein